MGEFSPLRTGLIAFVGAVVFTVGLGAAGLKLPWILLITLVLVVLLPWGINVAVTYRRSRRVVDALGRGDTAKARAALQSMSELRSNPKAVAFFEINESVALILEERYLEAREKLEKLDRSTLGNNAPMVINNIAWCDIHLGRSQDAADSLSPLVTHLDGVPSGFRPALLNTMGVALFTLERVSEAVPLLEEAVSGGKRDRYAQAIRCFYLGEAYSALGETDKAQPAYKRAIAECPASRYAERARQKLIPS